tara:strand:+ start:2499 stop:3323 length:825 start_codon:yes stop_codon:yes gene_type:complete
MNNFVNPLFISSYIDIPQKGGYVNPLGTAAIDYHVRRPVGILSPVSTVVSPVSPVLSPVSTVVSPVSTVVSPVSTVVSPFSISSKSHVSIRSKSPTYNLGSIRHPINSPSISDNDLELTVSTPRRRVFSPVVASHPLNPYPSYDLNHYTNVNRDPGLLRSVTKMFYEKTMNKWILSDFEDLLSYLIIKNKNVELVKSEKELEKNKPESDTAKVNMKVEFIANYVFTKHDMRSFVKKFAIKANLDLWDLEKNKKYVKKALYKKIRRRLEKLAFHM